MLETVRSWAALAAAVWRAASRLGVATPPGRQQGERGRYGGGADGSDDVGSTGGAWGSVALRERRSLAM
eukprot:1063729-Pleurochrysis_carterae.AAC.1